MLKAYKYRIYPDNGQKIQIAKHLAAAVLFIIKRWHIGKSPMKKRKHP